LPSDARETNNVIAEHPQVVASMRKAYDEWWSEVRGNMINEGAVGPSVNPFKELYGKQFGGLRSDASN
jgi:arylsulfatase